MYKNTGEILRGVVDSVRDSGADGVSSNRTDGSQAFLASQSLQWKNACIALALSGDKPVERV